MSPSGQRARWGPSGPAWRLLIPAAIFLLGLFGMRSGVTLGPDTPPPDTWLTSIYYAMSLFVIGGVDLGVPHGPTSPGYVCLWAAYIFAPLVTAGVVAETALQVIGGRRLRLRRLRDHVVVCGAGRLAMLYIKRLRAEEEGTRLIVIERDPNNPRLLELEREYRAEIVIGDMSGDRVLDSVAVGDARRLLLLSNDDFVNLDTAARVLANHPALRDRIVAHVADLAFMSALPRESLEAGFEVFNSHQTAAKHLVEQRLLTHFSATEHRDLVVLAGFGRFGQTVLHQLQLHARGEVGPVVLLDLDAELNALRYDESQGVDPDDDDGPRHVISGDLRDPAVWKEIDPIIQADPGPPVIIVGTGDEGTNLHAALVLRERYPGAHITVRGFAHSPFAKQVADIEELHPFDLADLIASSMPTRWF